MSPASVDFATFPAVGVHGIALQGTIEEEPDAEWTTALTSQPSLRQGEFHLNWWIMFWRYDNVIVNPRRCQNSTPPPSKSNMAIFSVLFFG